MTHNGPTESSEATSGLNYFKHGIKHAHWSIGVLLGTQAAIPIGQPIDLRLYSFNWFQLCLATPSIACWALTPATGFHADNDCDAVLSCATHDYRSALKWGSNGSRTGTIGPRIQKAII